MVLSFFSGGKSQSVDELISRKKYGQAVELLKQQFKAGSRDPRLRLQLADVLAMAGKGREAVPILLGLADEFAVEGFAAKAISVLKKVQKIDPGRTDVARKLAGLIKEKQRDAPTVPPRSAPEFGMEEIGMEADPAAAPAEAPAPPPQRQLEPPADDPASLQIAEFASAAAQLATAPPEPEADLGDDLLGVIQQVLEESRPQPGSVPTQAVDSPLFSNFSEDELVAVIGGLELKSYAAGDILITEGEPGDSLFVLTSGVVKAFVKNAAGRNTQVRQMDEGAFFGEVSILSGKPRTATITAATACELLELDRATLDSICATHPHVRDVLQQFYDERVKSEQERRARSGQ